MTESNRGAPRITFSDGSTISAFTRFSTHDAFTDPIPHLEYDVAPPRADFERYSNMLRKGEFTTLLVNGTSQGGFLITETRRVDGDGGARIHVEAAGPLITPHEGCVDPDIVSVNSPTDIPVSETILKVMQPYGFDRIITDGRASVNSLTGVSVKGRKAPTDLAKLKHQAAQANEGETAYEFCARPLNRLGVALRMAVDGTLLVCAPDYDQLPIANVGRGDIGSSTDVFYGDVTEVDSNNGQFSEIQVRGARQLTSDTTEAAQPKQVLPIKVADLMPGNPSVYRSPIAAPYKPKVVKDKYSGDAEKCLRYATLIAGLRAARAYVVSGTVDGFVSKTGAVWSVDTVLNVQVDAFGLNRAMWVIDRTLTLDGDGSRTALTVIPLNSLLLGDPSA